MDSIFIYEFFGCMSLRASSKLSTNARHLDWEERLLARNLAFHGTKDLYLEQGAEYACLAIFVSLF